MCDILISKNVDNYMHICFYYLWSLFYTYHNVVKLSFAFKLTLYVYIFDNETLTLALNYLFASIRV
jgi:hypothetical protein